jgi:hypothetical protein
VSYHNYRWETKGQTLQERAEGRVGSLEEGRKRPSLLLSHSAEGAGYWAEAFLWLSQPTLVWSC